jgi:hypothetical protein
MKTRLAMFLATIFAVPVVNAQQTDSAAAYRWYATSQEQMAKEDVLYLDASSHTIKLRNDWRCEISAIGVANSRIVVCRYKDEAFEFGVQCVPARPHDQQQIRFHATQKKPGDLIEVGCWSIAEGRPWSP